MRILKPRGVGTQRAALPPPTQPRGLKGLGRLVKKTFTQWVADRGPKMAAALAYYTAFAIAPILVIAIAVAGLLFGADAARGRVSHEVAGLVGPQAAKGIELLLQNAWRPRAGIIATIVGVVALLFGASGVFTELQDSLNTIWKVKKKPGRGIWGTVKDRFLSFGMLLGVGFLLLVSLVLSASLQALGDAMTGNATESVLLTVLHEVVSFAVVGALFAAMFKVLPDADTKWKNVWLGAGITSLLFTAGKHLIGLYLGKSTIGSAYGAAGSFVILLLWVYYSSQIYFLGAEFTKVHADTHGPPPEPTPDADVIPPGRTPA